MGPDCTSFFKRLAELITAKNNERYASVINHIRTGMRFSILRSTLIGIRGERGRYKKQNYVTLSDVSLNLIPRANSYECR